MLLTAGAKREVIFGYPAFIAGDVVTHHAPGDAVGFLRRLILDQGNKGGFSQDGNFGAAGRFAQHQAVAGGAFHNGTAQNGGRGSGGDGGIYRG